jgi:hypothetical protein
MITWIWDPGLQWKLVYFSVMVCISTWDLGYSAYFITMVHTYPWDPGIWFHTLITSIDDNTFIRGMKCSVAREVVWGGGCRAHSDSSGFHSMQGGVDPLYY